MSDGELALVFTKVLDQISAADDDEEEYEATDRKYWEARSTKEQLKLVDSIFEQCEPLKCFEMKYNKFYIGLIRNGIATNEIREESPRVCYDDLNVLLEAVGYQTEYTENAVIWTKGNNVVTIEVEDNNYICRRNGVIYKTEGIVNAALIKLTEKDMQELFGITYEIDKIGEQAQIMINF